MGQTAHPLNNKEIVSKALELVTTAMQNTIATNMMYKYGDSWWNTQVIENKSKLGILRELKPVDYFDLEENREIMDTQLCCKLMENHINLFTNDKGLRSVVKNVRGIRNDICHCGETNFNADVAEEYMDTLIKFLEDFDLTVNGDLHELKNNIADVPTKSLFSDHVAECCEEGIDEPDTSIKVCNVKPSEKDYRDICIESTHGFLDEIETAQSQKHRTSRQTTNAIYKGKKDRAIKLKLDKGFIVDDATGLIVDGVDYQYRGFSFQNFDSVTETVLLYPEDELEKNITENSAITLYSDMKWLIRRTGQFFEKFGNYINFPPDPKLEFVKDLLLSSSLKDMTPEQSDAVKMIMNNPLTYVWGIPGSGKTKYVLAKSINECLSRDEKVLVVAPTNYALEQVLEGLISAFNGDDKCKVDVNRDLIRIGTPTADFLSKFPNICEKKGVQSRVTQYKNYLFNIKTRIADKKYTKLKPSFKEALDFSKKSGKNSTGAVKLVAMTNELREAMSKDPRYRVIAIGVNASNIMKFLDNVNGIIYSKKDKTDKNENDDISIEKLESELAKYQKELDDFQRKNPKGDLNSCRIIAMTLSKFIISYGPAYIENHNKLEINHVFLDEAGYCNCIQAMALFTLGAPVTMLGDHMQLPPVCEIDEEKMKDNISNKDHKYDYLWDTSALYADALFDDDMNLSSELYMNGSEPLFNYTSVAKLTTTHRFGQNLATILGETVYNLPLKSSSKNEVELVIIDAHIDSFPEIGGRAIRKNEEEALKVIAYAEKIPGDESFIILTPYNEQIKCIKYNRRSIDEKRITTIHKSQGKEWDVVIVSVCDGRACTENKPPRFTSIEDKGLKVINTAISRAKKKLVIVCDVDYWSAKPNELLGKIVLSAKK